MWHPLAGSRKAWCPAEASLRVPFEARPLLLSATKFSSRVRYSARTPSELSWRSCVRHSTRTVADNKWQEAATLRAVAQQVATTTTWTLPLLRGRRRLGSHPYHLFVRPVHVDVMCPVRCGFLLDPVSDRECSLLMRLSARMSSLFLSGMGGSNMSAPMLSSQKQRGGMHVLPRGAFQRLPSPTTDGQGLGQWLRVVEGGPVAGAGLRVVAGQLLAAGWRMARWSP